MALHDIGGKNRTSLMPSLERDTLDPNSRRVNQNVEILTAQRTILQAVSDAIPNGNTASLVLNFENVQNDGPVVAFWELAVYVNSISNANLLYPYHGSSTVDLSQWQIIGLTGVMVPDTPYSAEDLTTPQTRDIRKATFRNISAGTVSLVYAVRARYTFNRG